MAGAVGVCERDKSDSRPLEQKKSVPLDKLLEGIAFGVREPDSLSSLAGRLIGLEKRLDPELQSELEKLAGGKKLSQIACDQSGFAAKLVGLQSAAANNRYNFQRQTDLRRCRCENCGNCPRHRPLISGVYPKAQG